MKKFTNKKGFTLAELLIVVAIIAVLVAISIPIFTTQLNKAKYAADEANARSIYAELQADYLANGGTQKITLSATSVTAGTATTIEITEADGAKNSYKFSGIVGVTFTAGTSTASPVVTVAACTKAGVSDAVTFGGTVTTTP